MKRKIVKKLLAGMLVASMCVSQIPYGAIDGVSVVYGAEYLVNGDFSSDIESDWNVEAGSDRFELASDEWDTTNSTQALKFSEAEMVNSKSYKVDEDGSLDLSIKNKSTYELVSKEEAKAIEKQIKATIKVKNSSKDVKKGKTTKVTFDKKMNMNNVKSITYSTADKKIATISKSGKVTAKAKGTVKVKATVTLKNGSKKTVTMKIKVK